MATVTGEMILNRAALTLLDETGVRWTPEEMLAYLSDGQRETVILKPSAHTENKVVQLVPGTRQSLPGNGIALVYCSRNMGMDGNTPGRSVRRLTREVLDVTRPMWHTEPGKAEVEHWMYEEIDPKTFYVTPPQPDPAAQLEIAFASSPEEIADKSLPISLDDAYQTPLYYYVMSRALAKESGTADPNKSMIYHEMFRATIQGRQESLYRLQAQSFNERMPEGQQR